VKCCRAVNQYAFIVCLFRLCIQFVYLPIIKKQLGEVVLLWNSHSIRKQKNGDVVSGIPDILFSTPEIAGNILSSPAMKCLTELNSLTPHTFHV